MATLSNDANQPHKSKDAEGIQKKCNVIALKLSLSVTVVRDGSSRILEIVKNPEMVLDGEGQQRKEEKTRWKSQGETKQ